MDPRCSKSLCREVTRVRWVVDSYLGRNANFIIRKRLCLRNQVWSTWCDCRGRKIGTGNWVIKARYIVRVDRNGQFENSAGIRSIRTVRA